MKRWNIISSYDDKKDIVQQILLGRGISDTDNFLTTPPFSYFIDKLPHELKESFNEARNIILDGIKDKKHIIIYGDYDADGICSTAVLYKTLKEELKTDNISYFIPNRSRHGYGLSMEAINYLENENSLYDSIVITVDTGITAVNEINYLKNKGSTIVIVDHHQKPDELPNSECIVWYDCTVATTLCWILSKYLGSSDKSLISLSALATVTDVQPLVGFNRAIVKAGLAVLNTNPPPGIKELMILAGKGASEITAYDLGWVIGPRLNAPGRLENADTALILLLENNTDRIKEAAYTLNKLNTERQDITADMFKTSVEYEENNLPVIIVSASENYHEGIIGLISAKITQKYYRPSIVISLSNELGKGSARSIKGIDIISLLRKFEYLFENLGGHPMAAGFSIKKENIPILEKEINLYLGNNIDENILIPELNIDIEMPIDKIDNDLITKIERMKPYGIGNEEPLFMSKYLGISEKNIIGKENQHVVYKFYKEGKYYKGIYFDGVLPSQEYNFGDKVDVVYTLKRNQYQGKVSIDLIIKDLRKCLT